MLTLQPLRNSLSLVSYAIDHRTKTRLEKQGITYGTYQKTTSLAIRVSYYVLEALWFIGELLLYFNKSMKEQNLKRYESYFKTLNTELQTSTKPICVLALAHFDHNGANYHNTSFYSMHRQIEELKKEFAIAPVIVSYPHHLFNHLKDTKAAFPNKSIELLLIVGHGSPRGIAFGDHDFGRFNKESLKTGNFNELDADATIVLNSCSTAKSTKTSDCFAKLLAESNPGKTVYGADCSIFESYIHLDGHRIKDVTVETMLPFSLIPAKRFHYDPPPKPEEKRAKPSFLAQLLSCLHLS